MKYLIAFLLIGYFAIAACFRIEASERASHGYAAPVFVFHGSHSTTLGFMPTETAGTVAKTLYATGLVLRQQEFPLNVDLAKQAEFLGLPKRDIETNHYQELGGLQGPSVVVIGKENRSSMAGELFTIYGKPSSKDLGAIIGYPYDYLGVPDNEKAKLNVLGLKEQLVVHKIVKNFNLRFGELDHPFLNSPDAVTAILFLLAHGQSDKLHDILSNAQTRAPGAPKN